MYICIKKYTIYTYSFIYSYGPSAGAVDAESPKSRNNNKSKNNGHEISVFLMHLHDILHARSFIHFLWLPHTPKPPRPLKRLKDFNSLLAFSKLLLFGLLLEPIWAMVTRPEQEPLYYIHWGHAKHSNHSNDQYYCRAARHCLLLAIIRHHIESD